MSGVSLGAALFFARGHLAQGLARHEAAMVEEIETTPDDHVLEVEEGAWVRALVERYRIEAPVLRPDEITMDESVPVQVDVSSDTSRIIRIRPALVRGYRTPVHIPFSGDPDIFGFLPSSHILVQLHAEVGDGELVLNVEYPEDRPVDITAYTEEFVRRVETNLTSAREDIARFNESLERDAQAAIARRRETIERHREHLAATGYPVVARDPTKTIVIRRLPAPALPATAPGKRVELEPVLANEVYEHIVYVIRQHSRSMERNPQAYAGMGEEDRRHVILDVLNTHYPGAGTAETFNYSGHTDIRLEHEGRSLFIAECKFWHGQKKFLDTLHQLFSYQAWRDTKLAVLMFVREQELTTMMERGRAALEEHPQFVAWQRPEGETELRATVSCRGDERRHADLTVFFIATPTD